MVRCISHWYGSRKIKGTGKYIDAGHKEHVRPPFPILFSPKNLLSGYLCFVVIA